ncbi:hypothetical protein ACTS93_13845 [Empedobacter falsenii]
MVLGIIDKYFSVAEDLYRIRILSKNNIERFLMLMYFPTIITFLIFTNSGIFTSVLILCLIISSAFLIIPAIFNKIFFLYRNLNIQISNYQYDYSEVLSPIVINYESASNKFCNKIFELKTLNNNLIYYNPKKYKTSKRVNGLKDFYNKEANKYFDVKEYDRDYFINLFFNNKYLDSSEKISLNSELNSIEIKIFLIELKIITKISQLELAKLFLIYSKSNGFVNINMKSINSSYSQLNRIFKS